MCIGNATARVCTCAVYCMDRAQHSTAAHHKSTTHCALPSLAVPKSVAPLASEVCVCMRAWVHCRTVWAGGKQTDKQKDRAGASLPRCAPCVARIEEDRLDARQRLDKAQAQMCAAVGGGTFGEAEVVRWLRSASSFESSVQRICATAHLCTTTELGLLASQEPNLSPTLSLRF